MNVSLHPEAQQEVRDAFDHYEGESAGLGPRFLSAVDDAIEEIRQHPYRWPEHLEGTRRYRLHKFPYGLVYYVVGTDDIKEVEVLAVMDLRRRPVYWLRRLRKK